mmetsp:Transcript_78590/g.124043  ORF Transcript_78590/g.124043 Transcript_78590/m.124043 type:complete len:443 (+) Transcript_78590:45-1373(+)
MASHGRKRFHVETRARGKDVSSSQNEALPGGAFARSAAPQPKSIADFEAALTRAESGGADVVQVWTDFALWAKRLSRTEQLSILRRACRSLAGENRHAQDIRQLRLWVMLADKESRPAQIFQHLEARGIGTNHALLYEAWAHCLEAKHDFEGAADAYRRGLTSLAQPQARLRARRADFDERMRQRVSRTPSRTEAFTFSTPPRESRSWRLSHFRAIKTSLKKPSKYSALRFRTPRKHSEEAKHRHVPKDHRCHKEEVKRTAMNSARARTVAEMATAQVDTRSRLTCRKQVAVEGPFRLPSLSTLSEKCDKQAKRQIEKKLAEHEKARPVSAKDAPKASVPENAGALKALQSNLQVNIPSKAFDPSKPPMCEKAVPTAKPKTETRRGLLGWLVPFSGFFGGDEDEDYLEDCEEESVLEDDEPDDLLPSPPEAKRRRLMGWLPW